MIPSSGGFTTSSAELIARSDAVICSSFGDGSYSRDALY